MNRQKVNWAIDAVLFSGFLSMFFLDVTGLTFHQWVGVAAALLAEYHLLAHWDWVKAVTCRFFDPACKKARWNYLVDAGLGVGFLLILSTGLVISSWADLPLHHYAVWKDVHVAASVVSLLLVWVKIGMHWRWIVCTLGKIFPPKTRSVAAESVRGQHSASRREFLRVMTITGAASLLAVSQVLKKAQQVQAEVTGETSTVAASQPTAISSPTATTMPSPTAVETQTVIQEPTQVNAQPVVEATAVPTATATSPAAVACTVRCPRGCSYPGQCRKYTDQNGNGLCDLGECL